MVFSLVEYICFDLAFSSVTQFGGSGPFVVMQEFAVGVETVDIVLTKIIHLQEHLIVIIPPRSMATVVFPNRAAPRPITWKVNEFTNFVNAF